MKNSKIEWTDHTFNPWTGCTKVSPGCEHCYAEGWSKRSGIVQWGPGKPRRRTSVANWKEPLKWNSTCIDQDGETHHIELSCAGDRRPRVFCASLADWLDDEVPIEWLADLLKLIHDTPNLDWLLLTKRPENWRKRIEAVALESLSRGHGFGGWVWAWKESFAPKNVWIGTTVENQVYANRRVPELLRIPAQVRFLSCEPLLGPVQLFDVDGAISVQMQRDNPKVIGYPADFIDWVICGGESGPGARPMHPSWARSLRDQCAETGVPFLFKQWGEHDENEERVGKKKAGRVLDGVEHDGFPMKPAQAGSLCHDEGGRR